MKVIDNELLSKYIYEVGYSITELSRMTNVSRSTIDNILSGKNYPSYKILNCNIKLEN